MTSPPPASFAIFLRLSANRLVLSPRSTFPTYPAYPPASVGISTSLHYFISSRCGSRTCTTRKASSAGVLLELLPPPPPEEDEDSRASVSTSLKTSPSDMAVVLRRTTRIELTSLLYGDVLEVTCPSAPAEREKGSRRSYSSHSWT